MNIDQIRNYSLSKPQVSEDFPFDEDTLVFRVLGKIFALAPLENWESGKASLNLKCDPEYAITLREEYNSIRPGFHMNKKHWNSVYIHENELATDFIFKLIDHSYDMVVKSMPKKMRDQLTQ